MRKKLNLFSVLSAAVLCCVLLTAVAFFIACAINHEKPSYALKVLLGKAD